MTKILNLDYFKRDVQAELFCKTETGVNLYDENAIRYTKGSDLIKDLEACGIVRRE